MGSVGHFCFETARDRVPLSCASPWVSRLDLSIRNSRYLARACKGLADPLMPSALSGVRMIAGNPRDDQDLARKPGSRILRDRVSHIWCKPTDCAPRKLMWFRRKTKNSTGPLTREHEDVTICGAKKNAVRRPKIMHV